MFKKLNHGLSILIIVLFLAGCASSGTGSVRTRAYVMEKERVDQSMEEGNYGYIFGTPVPEDRSKYKKTRQMHVLEFTKEEEPEEMAEPLLPPPPPRPQSSTPPPRQERRRPPVEEKYEPVVLPNFDEEPVRRAPEPRREAPRAGSYTEYTIEKDDTLQKISKKFYDTYRKWPQIYEANKDKIKDPNRIKPGLTIRIPVE